MAIITREEKGSKLTIAEMDGNLTTLNNQSFQKGQYVVEQQIEGGVNTSIISVDSETNDVTLYSENKSDGSIIAKSLAFAPTESVDTIVAGTYENIEPTVSDKSSGTGLVVTVVVIDNKGIPLISSVRPTSPGSGYASGETLSIPTSALGADPSTESITYRLKDGDFLKPIKSQFSLNSSGIIVSGLPTSNPGVFGALWIDTAASHSLKVSQG